jgi:hypothetical protein
VYNVNSFSALFFTAEIFSIHDPTYLILLRILALEAALQVDADLVLCACVLVLQAFVDVDARDQEVSIPLKTQYCI